MNEANRIRKVQLNFRVTEQERRLIEDRMQDAQRSPISAKGEAI